MARTGSKDGGKNSGSTVDPDAVTGEAGKNLPAAVVDAGATLAGKSMTDLFKTMGVDGSSLNALDEVVASRLKASAEQKSLVDPGTSDIDKARAIEMMSGLETARGEVVADVGIETALTDKDFRGALEYIGAKQRLRGGHFDTMVRRQKMEVDNLQLHRKQITLGIINKMTLELTGVMKEVGVSENMRDEILTKLAERADVMVSD